MFAMIGRLGAPLLLAAGLVFAPAAQARHYNGGHGGWHYGGGWYGRGWGWGVGIGFYDPWWPGYYGYWPYYSHWPYYGAPYSVYEYEVAPVPVVPPAAYYYCDNPAGYYPTIPTCLVPWRPVPPR